MTTEPHSATQATLSTSLRRTSEWNVYLIKGGRREKKPANEKQLEPWSTPHPQKKISQAKPRHWLGFNLA